MEYNDYLQGYLSPDQGGGLGTSTRTRSSGGVYNDHLQSYLQPAGPATDDFDKGVLGGGFFAGANALGSIFGGLASATGDVFNWDNMQRWGAEVAEKYGDYAAEHGRDIPSLEQVFESDEAFTDFARWAGFNVTSGVTTALPGLAAAALGAIAGPVLGVGAGSAVLYGMGVGDITASQLEGKDDPDVRWALAGGVPYAVAERMFGAGAILARRLTGRQKRSLATSYLKRMASDVPFAMGSEATAEGVQTILTEGIRRLEGGEPIEDVIGDKNFWKAVGEASAAGAVAGAPFGAVSAIPRPRQETAGGERRGKAQPTAGLPPQQPGAATSPDQATPPAEQMLSDEDRASPLPDADIAEGRRIIDEAVGSAPANGVLDTVGYPHIGTKVTVSSPDINDGQPFQGTISDGMEMEPGIVAAAVTDDETGIVHYIDSDSDAEVVRVPTEEEKQAMADDSRVAEEYQEVVRQAVEIQQAHILHEELRRENSDTFDAVPRERRKSLVSAIKARVDQERKNQEQVVKDVEQAVKEDEKAQQEAEKQAEADAKEFDDRLLFVDKQEELREQTDADLGDGTYTEHMRDVLTEMGVDTNDADGFDSVRTDPKRRTTYDKLITSRIRRTSDRRKKEEEARRQEDKQAEEARERSRTEAERRGIERKPGQSFDDWWNGLPTADRRLVASTAMYGGDDLSYLSNLKGDLPQGTKSRLETEFPPMDQEGKETVPQDDGEFTKLQGRIGRVDDQDIPTWWDSLSQEDKHQAAVAAGYINGGLDEIVKTAGSALRTADVSTFDRRFPPFARVPDTEPDTGPRRLTAPEESEPTPEPTPEPKAEKTDYKEVIRQLKEGERTKPTEAEQLQPLPPTRPLQEGYNAEFYTKQRTDDGNFRRVKGKFVGAITTDQGDTHHFMLYHKGRGEWHVIHAETGLSAARGSTRHKALHDYQRRSGRSKSEKANFSRGLHNVETLRKDGELINQHLAFADEQPAQEPTKVDEKQPTETKAPATEPKPKKTRQPKTTSPLKVGDDAEYVVVGVDRRKSRVKGSYAFSWTAPDGKVHHFMVRQAGPVRDASGKGPNVNWVVEHAGTGANMYWNDTGKDNTKEDAVNAVRERVNSWGTDETRRLNRWFESFADINQNLVFADEPPAPAPEPEATPKPEPKDPEPKEPEPKDKKPKEPEDRLDWARILPDPADAKALENLVVVRFHGPEEPVMLKQWDADALAWLLKKLPEVKDAETYFAGMPKGTEELHYRVRVHFNSEGRRPRALQRSFTVVEIKKGLQDQLKAWRDEVRNRHPLTDDEQQELVDRVTTWLDEARNTAVTKEPKPKETDEQTEETTDEETVETEEDQTTQDDDTTEETEKPKDVDEKPKEKPKDKKPKEPEKEPAPTPEPEKLPKTRPLKMGNRAEYFIRPDPNKPEVMHKVKGSLVYTWVDADGASHPFMAHKEEDGWEIHHVGTGIRAVGARTKSQSRQSVLELLTTLLGHKDSQRKHTDIAVATEAKLGTINEHLVFADGQPTQVKRRVVKEDDGKIKKTRPLKAGYKAQYFVRRSDKNLEKVKGEYVGSWTAPDGKVHHFMAHYMGDDLNKGVVLNHVPTWRIDHAESGFMVNSSPWYEKAKTDFRDRFDDPSESESQRYMKTLNKPLEESGTINQHLVFADEEPVEPTTEPETQPTKRYSISDSVVDESNLTRRDHARINQALKKALKRIAPNVDKLDTSGDLLPEGATGFADYFGEIDGLLIALAVRGTSNKALLRSMQTLGHESIHALRFDGLFTLAEWQTLKDEADKQGWIEKYRIPERYPDLFGYVPDSGKTELLYEEAIAEAFGDFLAGQIKTSPESHHLMLRIWYYVKQLAEAIRKRVMDLSPETRKVFTDIAEGVVGERYKPDSDTRKEAKARRETEQDLLAYSAAVDTLDEKWLESYGEQFADVYDLDVHSFSEKMLLLLEEAETDGLLDPMGWLEDAVADLPEAQRAAFQRHWNQIAPEMALERRESRTRARTKPTTARLRKIFEDLKPKTFEPDENAQPFEMTEDEELYYDHLEEMAALGAIDDDNRPHREAPMRPDASPNTELEEIQAEIAAEDARTKRPSSPTKPVISDADMASMNRVMTRLVQGDPRKQRNDARINQALKKALKRIAPNVDKLETDPAYVKKVADRFRPESDVHGFMDYFVNFDGALIAVGVRSHPNNIDLWNAFKTLGHEAIHALRKDKLFTDAEWETLKGAAWDEKWFERYGIRSRYPELLDDLDMPTDAAYEEAIAEAFGEFWAGQLETKPEIKSLFVRLWDYVTQLAGAIRKKVMALPPDARKVFTDIAEGVVGERFDPDSDTRKTARAERSARTSSEIPKSARRYSRDAPGPKPYTGGVVFGDERADQDWQKAILGKDAEKQPFMRTLVDYINHFGSLWVRSHRHLPRETRFADAHAKLRIITAAPSVATENIVRYLHDLVKDLSQTDLELLTFKAIADDFQHDVAKGLEIPFFADHAEFQKEYGRINATMAERPDLMKRVHKRRRVVNKLKNEMIEWGLLTKEQATNPTYFRHQVLEYAMVSNAMGLNTSRNVRKPHYFERKGTRMVINARLVEVESEWMFRAMVGVESMKQLDALQKRYDEAKSLRAQIRMENRALIEEAIVREYSKRYGAQFGLISSIADIQALLADTDIDGQTRAGIRSNLPLYDNWMLASRYIGMGINTMQRDENFKVSDVPKSMADMFESIMTAKKDKTDDAADYMPLVAWLAQNGPEDAKYTIGARSMLKGIGQRRQFMKDTLGKQYVEPSDLDAALKRFNMDSEYRTWQIEPGNTMFWASTVPERVIEHFMVRLEQIQQDMVGKSPDKIDMTPWGMSEVEWLMGNIRQQLVMGGKKPQMVLPIELADTLDDMGAGLEEGPLGRIVSRAVRMHKQWLLINPRTWFRYNLQNMTGDLDGALAAFPKSLNVRKYINPAIDELWKVQIKREKPSERYMEAARRGVFDAGWSINEVYEAEANIGDVLNAKSLTQAQLRRVWRFFSRSTTFRENWLRYAMFMAVEDAIKRGETELPGVSPDLIMATVGYGAAKRQIVDATTDRADRAALIARESIGDYGDISVAGEYLRKRWLWFWSWQEINFKRYMRLASNAWAANDGFGKTEALTKIGARVGLRTSIWMFTRATIFLAMVHLWNHLFFPDEEEELSREDRWRLHVILGRDPTTGKIIQVRAPGALSDFLSIFGYEDIIQFITETQKGRGEWSEVAQSVALAPVNRVAQGLTPMIKAPAEALSGNSFFPKFWEPRTIKDPMRHALRSFRLEHEYDALLGRPSRGYFGSWAEAIVARRDPGENAYQYIRGLTFDFMRTQKGRDFRSQSFDDRSRAIYYWRKAIRFEDDAAAKKFRAKMTEYGVKPQNVRQIMKGMHPLGILAKNDRRAFMQTLTAEEKERVSHAIAWYRRLFE